MTELLERAFDIARELPPDEQDALASLMLEELEDERRWQEKFAASQDLLSAMAARVRQDIRAGRVRKMGIDEL